MFESLLPTVTSVGGGFLIGLALGFFLKKILKILMFIAGGLVALLLYLVQQQIISVNIAKLEDSFTLIFPSLVSIFDNVTHIGDTASVEIPMASGLSAGFTFGLMKG